MGKAKHFNDLTAKEKLDIYGLTIEGMNEEFERKRKQFLAETKNVLEAALGAINLTDDVIEKKAPFRRGVLRIEEVKRSGDGLFYLTFYPYLTHKRSFKERAESEKPSLYKSPAYRVRIRPQRVTVGLAEATDLFEKAE